MLSPTCMNNSLKLSVRPCMHAQLLDIHALPVHLLSQVYSLTPTAADPLAEGSRLTVESRRLKVAGGRWQAAGGRWWWQVPGGRWWQVVGGGR